MRRDGKGRKQAGFVVTAELLLVTTVLGIGLVTGMTKLRDQTVAELSDLGSAIGSIDNSYQVAGTTWFGTAASAVAETIGWGFTDAPDVAAIATEVGGDGQKIKYVAQPTNSTAAAAAEAPTF